MAAYREQLMLGRSGCAAPRDDLGAPRARRRLHLPAMGVLTQAFGCWYTVGAVGAVPYLLWPPDAGSPASAGLPWGRVSVIRGRCAEGRPSRSSLLAYRSELRAAVPSGGIHHRGAA